jgi:protein tyrosine phosphatase (PTP) superfamily phosphohydrolase (DUF442 family)
MLAPYLAVLFPLIALRRARAERRIGHEWRTWVTPDILLGGFIVASDVDALRKQGIGAVVNVSRELPDPAAQLVAAGIGYLRVPCWDMFAPDLAEASKGVEFIAASIRAGKPVYVHCASGVGRSVMLVLCYLVAHEGADADAALAEMVRKRPRVSLRTNQRRFVDRFIAWRMEQAKLSGSTG